MRKRDACGPCADCALKSETKASNIRERSSPSIAELEGRARAVCRSTGVLAVVVATAIGRVVVKDPVAEVGAELVVPAGDPEVVAEEAAVDDVAARGRATTT